MGAAVGADKVHIIYFLLEAYSLPPVFCLNILFLALYKSRFYIYTIDYNDQKKWGEM